MRETRMLRLALFLSSIAFAQCNHDGSDDPLDWLRESVPGEPGVDYPVFAQVEETGFDCAGRVHGGQILFYSIPFYSWKKISIFGGNEKIWNVLFLSSSHMKQVYWHILLNNLYLQLSVVEELSFILNDTTQHAEHGTIFFMWRWSKLLLSSLYSFWKTRKLIHHFLPLVSGKRGGGEAGNLWKGQPTPTAIFTSPLLLFSIRQPKKRLWEEFKSSFISYSLMRRFRPSLPFFPSMPGREGLIAQRRKTNKKRGEEFPNYNKSGTLVATEVLRLSLFPLK